MNKNFFKPRFRISKVYQSDKKTVCGFSVHVRYWWMPLWSVAWMSVESANGGIRFDDACFDTEDEAVDYISRRFSIIRYNDIKDGGRNGDRR